MRAPLRVWRPAASIGVPLGAAIAGVALVCCVALLAASATSSSAVTRLIGAIGALAALSVSIAVAVGAWWCATLRYVLAPAALEVRCGSRLLRVSYDEIDEVVGRHDDEAPVPMLWPGVYIGQAGGPSDSVHIWRGTTLDARYAVVVIAGGTGHVVTPAEPRSFREELIQHARSAPYAGTGGETVRRTWLDAVPTTDGWVRVLLLVAGAVATGGIATDVVRFGALQADGIGAAWILYANAAAALGLSIRWPVVGRLLAAGALAGQLLALG